MTCSNHYFLVCEHVANEGAEPIVDVVKEDRDNYCDGYIYCRACGEIAWDKLPRPLPKNSWQGLCSHCCRKWIRKSRDRRLVP